MEIATRYTLPVTVYTVFTVFTIQTDLHFLNSNMNSWMRIYILLGKVRMLLEWDESWAKCGVTGDGMEWITLRLLWLPAHLRCKNPSIFLLTWQHILLVQWHNNFREGEHQRRSWLWNSVARRCLRKQTKLREDLAWVWVSNRLNDSNLSFFVIVSKPLSETHNIVISHLCFFVILVFIPLLLFVIFVFLFLYFW